MNLSAAKLQEFLKVGPYFCRRYIHADKLWNWLPQKLDRLSRWQRPKTFGCEEGDGAVVRRVAARYALSFARLY